MKTAYHTDTSLDPPNLKKPLRISRKSSKYLITRTHHPSKSRRTTGPKDSPRNAPQHLPGERARPRSQTTETPEYPIEAYRLARSRSNSASFPECTAPFSRVRLGAHATATVYPVISASRAAPIESPHNLTIGSPRWNIRGRS